MFILLLAMKVDIEFNDAQCSTLLDMQGYVVEEVTLYYNPDTNPYYDNGTECDPSLLRGVEYKVAYKRGHKPAELEKEYPLISECRIYAYSNVLNNLVSNWLYHVMLKNEPYTW